MFVSVVVPCYRSAQTLPELVARLAAVLPGAAIEHEIVLVVDGSPDDTWDVAADLARSHREVRAIQLARNYGQHNALIAGVRAARHDIIVTMDDDLQHLPEEVPRLLAALTDDIDLVYACPREEEHGLARSLASQLVKMTLSGPLGVPDARSISAFRAFRMFLRDGFDGLTGPHASIDVALSWGTTRIGCVDVRMDHRMSGRSGYTLSSLMRHAVNLLVGYSTAPLRFVSGLGLVVGAFGLLLVGIVLWSYLTGAITVAGFTSVASMIALFSSAQILGIGVLGEYLGRVHACGMGRPTYVIRSEIDRAAAEETVDLRSDVLS
ncbi:glycosyltransferase family 2 protein [Actinoallomurus sp. NPDC050550]|uniref:glycosyltransferase family 2 protein n=1 Tax=Actinoallomurus sp. NPDC050550 TaxID=3154937 RepID=UPI0033E0AA98